MYNHKSYAKYLTSEIEKTNRLHVYIHTYIQGLNTLVKKQRPLSGEIIGNVTVKYI